MVSANGHHRAGAADQGAATQRGGIWQILASTVSLAWGAADAAFTPRTTVAPPSRTIENMQKGRICLGVIAVAGVSLAYESTPSKVVQELVTNTALAVGLALYTVPFCLAVLLIRMPRESRRLCLRRAKRMAWAAVKLHVAVLLLYSCRYFEDVQLWALNSIPFGLGFFLTLPLYIYLIFVAIFALRALFLTSRHLFRSAEIHPLLAPLCSPLVAWSVLAVNQFRDTADIPHWVGSTLALAGAISVTLLAGFEWLYFRRRFGVTTRSDLGVLS